MESNLYLTEAYSIKYLVTFSALFNMFYANLYMSMLGGGAPNSMDEVSKYLKTINENVPE
jgi:hypothetical protein